MCETAFQKCDVVQTYPLELRRRSMTPSGRNVFARAQPKQGRKQQRYWSLVETVRTPDGPRQRTLCYLGKLNDSAQARWLKTIEVFNENGEAQQLKLFPSEVEPPANDPDVAQVVLKNVRLERTRQLGPCYLGWQLFRRLKLDEFFASTIDTDGADVAWSQVAAILAINRLCAPGSELAIEQRWYPATALGDILHIEEGKINDTRLYRWLRGGSRAMRSRTHVIRVIVGVLALVSAATPQARAQDGRPQAPGSGSSTESRTSVGCQRPFSVILM